MAFLCQSPFSFELAPTRGGPSMANYYSKFTNITHSTPGGITTRRCQRLSLANEKAALDAVICTVEFVSDTVEFVSDIGSGVSEEAS